MENRSPKDTYAIRAQGQLLVEKLELMLTLARLIERCANFISVERAMSVNNTILDMSVGCHTEFCVMACSEKAFKPVQA